MFIFTQKSWTIVLKPILSTLWFATTIIIGIIYIPVIFMPADLSSLFFFPVIQTNNVQKIKKLEQENIELKKRVHIIEKKLGIVRKTTITAYSSSIDETDSDPHITAFMSETKPWTVAVSRDLLKQGWTPGRKVWIEGLGVHAINHKTTNDQLITSTGGIFQINDIMHKRWSNRLDVWCPSKQHALDFGIHTKTAVLILEDI